MFHHVRRLCLPAIVLACGASVAAAQSLTETTLQLLDPEMQPLAPQVVRLLDVDGNVFTPVIAEDGKLTVHVEGKLFIEFPHLRDDQKTRRIELRVESAQKIEFTLMVDPVTGAHKALSEKIDRKPKKGMLPKRFNGSTPTQNILVAPPNDACAAATAAVLGANAITNVDATSDGPAFSCASSFSKDVWFSWTAPATGTLTAETCGSGAWDSVLAIYSGVGCPPGASIACNDEGGTGCTPNSKASAAVVSGTSYLIRVASWSTAAAGTGTLTLTFAGPPANDECASATPVTCGSSTTQSNAAATSNVTDPIFSCRFGGPGAGARSLWYSFVAAGPNVTLSTDNSVVTDTLLGLYSGTCGSLTELFCNDDISGSNFQSLINATGLTTGQTYYIQLSAFSASTGTGNVTLDVTCPTGPPPGDACADAIAIACGGVETVNTATFSTDASDPAFSCRFGSPAQGFGSAWFTFVATDTSAFLSTAGSVVFDTLLAVYDGTCGSFTEIACNDDIDFDTTNFRSEVCATGLTIGNTYYVQVAGWTSSDVGDIELALTCPCPVPPANDDCANAEVAVVPQTINVDLTNATTDGAAVGCGASVLPQNNVWYLVAGTGGNIRASTCNNPTVVTDTVIAVYCADCGDLVCVGGNDDLCTTAIGSFKSSVTFCSQLGANYLITVGTYPGAIPDVVQLQISQTSPSCTVAVNCLPTGACCLADGSCAVLTADDCATQGGAYQGDDVPCTADLGLVADPSFEGAAPAGDSPSWTETSTVFGTPLCDPGFCGLSIARTGTWYSWFGGTNSANTDTLEQVVTIPTGTPILEFWMFLGVGSAADSFTVKVDGNIEFSILGNDVTYTGQPYKLVSLPLAAYADGGNHTLRFEGVKTAGHGFNAFMDDISITGAAISCEICYDLDFETDDSGASMPHGAVVDSEYDGGSNFPVTITGSNPAILNSTTGPASQDPDLLVGTGNILICQNDANLSQCGAGIYCTHNDDEDGGTLTFSFASGVAPESIVLIDIDAADPTSTVVLTDGSGNTRTYTVPADWTGDLVSDGPPGYGTLDLTTLANQAGFGSIATAADVGAFDGTDVVQIDVNLGGSGGVDNLTWCE